MSSDGSKLPPEILEQIFFCMKELDELLKLRLVCRQWDGIITRENFLNTYFTRRLSSSTIDWYWNTTSDRNTTDESSALILHEDTDSKLPSTLYSECIITPPKSNYNKNIDIHFRATEQVEDKFIDTLSFWAYLPPDQSKINNWFVPFVSFNSAEVRRGNYRSFGSFFQLMGSLRSQPRDNNWLHIAFTRYLQQERTGREGFDVWLNGRLDEGCIQNLISSSEADDDRIYGKFIFECRYQNFTEAARIADLHLFRRSLSKLEIRAIAHQCTSPNKVKVGEYFLQKRHEVNDIPRNRGITRSRVFALCYLIRLFIDFFRRLCCPFSFM